MFRLPISIKRPPGLNSDRDIGMKSPDRLFRTTSTLPSAPNKLTMSLSNWAASRLDVIRSTPMDRNRSCLPSLAVPITVAPTR